MDNTHSLLERIMGPVERTYTKRKDGVRYLDGTSLTRSPGIPGAQRTILIIIVIAALAVGAFFIYNTVYASIRQAALAKQSVAENLSRPASIETIPDMTNYILLSDDEVKQAINDSGYTYYDVTSPGSVTGITVYKLPADVSMEDAEVLYTRGIDRLNASQASLILNGSWQFATDRTGTGSMVARYADFSTGDLQTALNNALNTQKFNRESIADTGVDDAGNTYASGTIDVGGTLCVWRVSVIPLDDMYSVSGLPEEACYVGIRLTKQIQE